MNKIVWVTQESNLNFAPAEEFGEVRFITNVEWSVYSGQAQSAMKADIRKFLSEYVPGQDYILVAGNPITAAQILMSLNGMVHQLLKWDGRNQQYIEHTTMEIS